MESGTHTNTKSPGPNLTAHIFKLLIGGRLIGASQRLAVINPATGKAFAECPRGDVRLLDEAIEAAKTAFPVWRRTPVATRATLLLQLADALEKRRLDFSRLLTLEQGKPLYLAAMEVNQSVELLRIFAGMSLGIRALREGSDSRIFEQRTPLGIVALIVPWNFPLLLLMFKLAPALLAGNSVVAKPAPTTPLTTLLLGELCAAILPAGLVNIITDQNDLGELLTAHPNIAKVAFTGSTATGRRVMGAAASTLKRLTLELGGNDAAIVMEDADPQEVASGLFLCSMLNSGQICLAIKRVYVHYSLYEEICAELATLAAKAVVGDGTDDGVEFGPLQNKAQFERVLDLIEDCQVQGRIIAGGYRLRKDGYFIAPTIVRDIPEHARIVQEEQFGPILPVLRYADIDDAISRVNASEYGLAASVWGTDTERALEVALQLDVGTVWINKHLELPLDIPIRGAKQSGFGAELGREGLEEYTQAKIISVPAPVGSTSP